ncbi:MAG: hypothetical protein ACLFOY_01050 [Desulfatibacillaceae bacterium]
MNIDSRVWYHLSDDARRYYLNKFGKVSVQFGGHTQDLYSEARPGEPVHGRRESALRGIWRRFRG